MQNQGTLSAKRERPRVVGPTNQNPGPAIEVRQGDRGLFGPFLVIVRLVQGSLRTDSDSMTRALVACLGTLSAHRVVTSVQVARATTGRERDLAAPHRACPRALGYCRSGATIAYITSAHRKGTP